MSRSALAAGVRQVRDTIAAQRRTDESDELLLRAFTDRHDDLAFAALVRRHGPMVLGVCRRVLGHQQDAEDAFQATFLVLARGAAAVRSKSALASFLHGTAHRIALGARRSAARRRKHEGQAVVRPAESPGKELLWREVQALLDEEIARLPEIYRSVFVLCCLENLSQAEAARRLGLKEVTVVSRLAGARRRLQRRLTRRGVELTALLAATALATSPASALPTRLLTATTNVAVPPAITDLMGAGLKGLSISKMKLATSLLLVGSLLTGAGLWAYHVSAALPTPALPEEPPAAAKTDDKPRATPPANETPKGVEIRGRVLGPNGKPKAGAKLLLLGAEDRVRQVGISAEDGRFAVMVPKKTTNYWGSWLLAQADGSGIDFLDLDPSERGNKVELRLVKDHVIRGRVVNTEGRPIHGVRVAVTQLDIYPADALDSFLAAWKNQPLPVPNGAKRLRTNTGTLCAATTDADGRFAVRGAGADRLVRLRLSGAGIVDSQLWVVNREGFDPEPYNQARRDNIPKGLEQLGVRDQLSGPAVDVVAEAEKPIRGVVADADTGKGRPGLVVHLTRTGRGAPPLSLPIQATTDAQGRYEIRGAGKAPSYLLEVLGDPSTGYLACQVWADDTPAFGPVTADIRVKKGVVITGKIIDRATGQSVPGLVEVGVLVDNPFVKDYPTFDTSVLDTVRYTSDDGTFRIVSIPGPVLLMGGPASRGRPEGLPERVKYKPAAPDPGYPRYFQKPHDFLEYLCPGGSAAVNFQSCKVLQIKPGVAVVKQDILLERAR